MASGRRRKGTPQDISSHSLQRGGQREKSSHPAKASPPSPGRYCLFPRKPASSTDPLEAVVRQALAAWYIQDPIDALDGALEEANLLPTPSGPSSHRTADSVIHKAINGTAPLPKTVAEGLSGALPQTDVNLSARIWQIAISPCKTPQDTTRYVDHLALLFPDT